MNGVQNSFIEYCVMYRNGAWPNYPGKNLGGLGAWFFDAGNCTIQFCEASYVQAATTDGGAFDIDYWQKNSTVQYCYGHDCSGYGVSVFGADPSFPTENATVRYNIFSNNGRDHAFSWEGDFFVYTWNGGLLNGVRIYNNTSYWNPAADSAAVKIDADFTGTNPNIFTNNIIYSKRTKLVYLKNDSLLCDNNIYWVTDHGVPEWRRKSKTYHTLLEWQQNTGHEKHSRFTDPMIVSPTYHGAGFPETQFNLKEGSPAIDAGVTLAGMGKRDFFGNKIPDESGNYDIGAHEYSPAGGTSSGKEVGPAALSILFPDGDHRAMRREDFEKHTCLLVFIDLNDLEATRSQLVFIKSMKNQYAGYGLKIMLIDESGVCGNKMRRNFIEDNELSGITFLSDIKQYIAGQYGIRKFPATLLVSEDGRIGCRWEELAPSPLLAAAIEKDLDEKLPVRHFNDQP
jgi:hypothetical protein